eukprot:362860-Chlamydomonas_euryale.AAC.13
MEAGRRKVWDARRRGIEGNVGWRQMRRWGEMWMEACAALWALWDGGRRKHSMCMQWAEHDRGGGGSGSIQIKLMTAMP